MGASYLMTKYNNAWDTVVPDPSLVSALSNPRSDSLCPISYQIRSMSSFSIGLDRDLQQYRLTSIYIIIMDRYLQQIIHPRMEAL